MLDVLRSWILGLAGAAIFCAVITELCPSGSTKKVLKLLCSLVMAMALLAPFINANLPSYSLNIAKYRAQAEKISSSAKESAEKLALRYAKLMRIIIKVLYPITSFFMWLRKRMVKQNEEVTPTVTESELESIIDTMEEEGVIDADDADLMQSVLDISERTIYDIMVPRVDIIGVEVEMSVEQIRDIFFENKYSRLPVYRDDKDHILGILSERDFFTFLLKNKSTAKFNILELITRPLYVSKTMKVDDLIRRMQIEKKHFAIVSDEYGGTSGIVTMEDALEEIVGEIYDEHDESDDNTDIIKISDADIFNLDIIFTSIFLYMYILPQNNNFVKIFYQNLFKFLSKFYHQ